jgi:hypothetical protein
MRVSISLLLAFAPSWGCSRHVSLEVRAHLMPEGYVRYEGSLAGPHGTYDEMVETACEHISQAPSAGETRRALGYCALYFYSAADRAFFFSHITRLEAVTSGVERSCTLPVDLLSPGQKHRVSLGGIREPSQGGGPEDPPSWRPTRFLDLETQAAWDKDMLVFSLEKPGVCTPYDYGYFQGEVSARRGDRWFLLGKVFREGEVRMPPAE